MRFRDDWFHTPEFAEAGVPGFDKQQVPLTCDEEWWRVLDGIPWDDSRRRRECCAFLVAKGNAAAAVEEPGDETAARMAAEVAHGLWELCANPAHHADVSDQACEALIATGFCANASTAARGDAACAAWAAGSSQRLRRALVGAGLVEALHGTLDRVLADLRAHAKKGTEVTDEDIYRLISSTLGCMLLYSCDAEARRELFRVDPGLELLLQYASCDVRLHGSRRSAAMCVLSYLGRDVDGQVLFIEAGSVMKVVPMLQSERLLVRSVAGMVVSLVGRNKSGICALQKHTQPAQLLDALLSSLEEYIGVLEDDDIDNAEALQLLQFVASGAWNAVAACVGAGGDVEGFVPPGVTFAHLVRLSAISKAIMRRSGVGAAPLGLAGAQALIATHKPSLAKLIITSKRFDLDDEEVELATDTDQSLTAAEIASRDPEQGERSAGPVAGWVEGVLPVISKAITDSIRVGGTGIIRVLSASAVVGALSTPVDDLQAAIEGSIYGETSPSMFGKYTQYLLQDAMLPIFKDRLGAKGRMGVVHVLLRALEAPTGMQRQLDAIVAGCIQYVWSVEGFEANEDNVLRVVSRLRETTRPTGEVDPKTGKNAHAVVPQSEPACLLHLAAAIWCQMRSEDSRALLAQLGAVDELMAAAERLDAAYLTGGAVGGEPPEPVVKFCEFAAGSMWLHACKSHDARRDAMLASMEREYALDRSTIWTAAPREAEWASDELSASEMGIVSRFAAWLALGDTASAMWRVKELAARALHDLSEWDRPVCAALAAAGCVDALVRTAVSPAWPASTRRECASLLQTLAFARPLADSERVDMDALVRVMTTLARCTSDDDLQTFGAKGLARVANVARMKVPLAEGAALDVLLNILTSRVACSDALHWAVVALLNLSTSSRAQVAICSRGLDALLEVNHDDTTDTGTCSTTAQVLNNLKANKANGAQLYRAELRWKSSKVLGSSKDPSRARRKLAPRCTNPLDRLMSKNGRVDGLVRGGGRADAGVLSAASTRRHMAFLTWAGEMLDLPAVEPPSEAAAAATGDREGAARAKAAPHELSQAMRRPRSDMWEDPSAAPGACRLRPGTASGNARWEPQVEIYLQSAEVAPMDDLPARMLGVGRPEEIEKALLRERTIERPDKVAAAPATEAGEGEESDAAAAAEGEGEGDEADAAVQNEGDGESGAGVPPLDLEGKDIFNETAEDTLLLTQRDLPEATVAALPTTEMLPPSAGVSVVGEGSEVEGISGRGKAMLPVSVLLNTSRAPLSVSRNTIKYTTGPTAGFARSRLAMWAHVEGSHVGDALFKKYTLPSGQRAFFYDVGMGLADEVLVALDDEVVRPYTLGALMQVQLPPCDAATEASLPRSDSQPAVERPAPRAPPLPSRHTLPVVDAESLAREAFGRLARKEPTLRMIVSQEENMIFLEKLPENVPAKQYWDIHKSIFAARRKQSDGRSYWSTPASTQRALECDLARCLGKKAMNKYLDIEIKSSEGGSKEEEMAACKAVLETYYEEILTLFDKFSCYDTVNPGTMSFNEFGELTELLEIDEPNSKLCKRGHVDTVFVAAKLHVDKEATDVPGNAISRSQFLEALFRLSVIKFLKSAKATSIKQAMSMLVDHIREKVPADHTANFNTFRSRQPYYLERKPGTPPIREEYRWDGDIFYNPEMDAMFTRNEQVLRKIWTTYKFKVVRKDPCMPPKCWVAIFKDSGLLGQEGFRNRDIALACALSRCRIVDEWRNRNRVVGLSFVDFLEAIARVAYGAPLPTKETLANLKVGDFSVSTPVGQYFSEIILKAPPEFLADQNASPEEIVAIDDDELREAIAAQAPIAASDGRPLAPQVEVLIEMLYFGIVQQQKGSDALCDICLDPMREPKAVYSALETLRRRRVGI